MRNKSGEEAKVNIANGDCRVNGDGKGWEVLGECVCGWGRAAVGKKTGKISVKKSTRKDRMTYDVEGRREDHYETHYGVLVATAITV